MHVKTLIQFLLARGGISADLLENLFKRYKMSSDQEFIKYIKTKEDNYEEGEELPPDKLLHLVDTKLKMMKEKVVWYASSKEE